jgi:hypothetical protein
MSEPVKQMLTPKEEGFCQSYILEGKNKADAYRANYDTSRMKEQTIWTECVKLSRVPKVAARIDELAKSWEDALQGKISMTVTKLLETYISLSFADPNELISVKVGCCRYCHGVGGGFQWREREYLKELVKWEKAPSRHEMPDIAGGFGFRMGTPPNQDCEECQGDGVERVVPMDTTKLSPGAKLLYRGAQRTKEGIKILFADKDKALDQIGRMLGAFDDKLRVNLDGKIQNLQLTTDDPAEASRIYQAMLDGKAD